MAKPTLVLGWATGIGTPGARLLAARGTSSRWAIASSAADVDRSFAITCVPTGSCATGHPLVADGRTCLPG